MIAMALRALKEGMLNHDSLLRTIADNLTRFSWNFCVNHFLCRQLKFFTKLAFLIIMLSRN